jgi:hypothetical protein
MRLILAFLVSTSLLGCQAPVPAPAATAPAPATKVMPDPQRPPQERELGQVRWQRDFAAAEAEARSRSLPRFLLFQEIPGCSTCTDFAAQVLCHPLLVPAIEQCFVPVAVRNNVEGEEGRIRDAFGEPSWNNPVVRLLGPDGKDLLPRRDGVWDPHGISQRMIAALEQSKQSVPGYLRVAATESNPATATAVFQMHCFWEGEATLGALDGVVRTKSAFVGGAEVVEVTYLPAVLSKDALTKHAQAKSCQPVAAGNTKAAPASDQQHALLGTPFAKVALTPMQRTKVHAALTLGGDPLVWLTPAQIAATKGEAAPAKRQG